MRTYYLFIIKNEFYKTYLENPISLYKTLENLFNFTLKDYKFGISLYHQLCEMHNIDVLQNYFEKKRYRKYKSSYVLMGKESGETTLIKLRASALIVTTNKNIPQIFKMLHYYNSYIFVCDFKNKDYFWLSNQYKQRRYF